MNNNIISLSSMPILFPLQSVSVTTYFWPRGSECVRVVRRDSGALQGCLVHGDRTASVLPRLQNLQSKSDSRGWA